MKQLANLAAALVLSLGLAYLFTFASPAMAAGGASGGARDAVCQGINQTGGACSDNGQGLTSVIKVVVQIISVVAGVAAVIMIIIAGLKYITSGGDSSKVASAKSTIVYAIVGLVIVALSQVIVRFVAVKAAKP